MRQCIPPTCRHDGGNIHRHSRGKAGPEEQFRDAPEEDTKEDLPLVLEDAEKQPKEGRPGAIV